MGDNCKSIIPLPPIYLSQIRSGLIKFYFLLCMAFLNYSFCFLRQFPALMMSRTHSEHTTHPHTDHTEHPHHLNHHFTTQEPTTTSTITPAPKTTQELCDILCAMQQGGDACHCLKPGLPGRKWRSFSCYFIFGDY